jgi:hypothetical protein
MCSVGHGWVCSENVLCKIVQANFAEFTFYALR